MGPCTAGKFSCLTKKGQECLSDDLKCDGASECLDALDENECERCNDKLFTCTASNNTHIECQNWTWVCDDHADCSDGSDEHDCNTIEKPQTDAPYIDNILTTTPKGISTHNNIANRSMAIKDGNGLDFFRSWHGLAVMSISVVCITLIVVKVILVRCRKSSIKANIRTSRSKTEMDDIHQSILPAEMTGSGCISNCIDSMEHHEYEDIDSCRNKRQQSGEYAVPQDIVFYDNAKTTTDLHSGQSAFHVPAGSDGRNSADGEVQNRQDIGTVDKDGYEVPVKMNEYTELLPTDECYDDKKAKTDLPSDENVFHVPARPDDRNSAYCHVYNVSDIDKLCLLPCVQSIGH